MDRPISREEAAVILWLLDHAAVGDISKYSECPVEELRVVGGCDCGCASLFFDRQKGGLTMIADAVARDAVGHKANLILWGRGGSIAWLEVIDVDPRVPHWALRAADLRSWEQLGVEDS